MTDELLLLFLTHKYFEQGKAIRGGALITDEHTRPVEFRCTSPIRPNIYQRALYGTTLDEYIFVDLIGVPLVNKALESVSLVIVEDKRFLGARPRVDIPIARLVECPDVVSRKQQAERVSLKCSHGYGRWIPMSLRSLWVS